MKSSSAALALTYLAAFCFWLTESRGVDLGLCGDHRFECQCGNPGYKIFIPVKQCTYFYRWRNYCKPCDKISEDQICPKYKMCLECDVENDKRCKSCPHGKYGDWCTYDCECLNGGTCNRDDGRCSCPANFEGLKCEIEKGCPLPPSNPNVIQVKTPPTHPHTIDYSCPKGQELLGPSRITCLPNYQWSDSPPRCARTCQVPPAPNNGKVIAQSVPVIADTVIHYSCDDSYILVGDALQVCQADGSWSGSPPICKHVTFCKDPGIVKNSQRSVQISLKQSYGQFPEETTIKYSCNEDLLLMGDDTLICKKDGTWSAPLPECIKVAETTVSCSTSGTEFLYEKDEKIRIHCPPGCATNNAQIWGTVIYYEMSSVCRAAIHAGRITNSGGPVYLVNNGIYSNFIGSEINGINSIIFPASGRSFRFDRILHEWNEERKEHACPPGWFSNGDLCIYLAEKSKAWEAAKSTCRNLGGDFSDLTEDVLESISTDLRRKGMARAWTGTPKVEKNITFTSDSTEDSIVEISEVNSTRDSSEKDIVKMPPCYALELQDKQTVISPLNCNTVIPYICTLVINKAKCETPEPIDNGYTVSKGERPDGFYAGSSVTYNCNALHYLSGSSVSTCNSDGTWSSKPPRCIKVTTCTDPPIPPYGSKTIIPPVQSGPGLAGTRLPHPGRLRGSPLSLRLRPPTSLSLSTISKSEADSRKETGVANVTLPEGHYRVGTRIAYNCVSRYYTLAGSPIRRCTSQGTWSGHLPSCVPVCGRSESPRSPFITHGNVTEVGQWPWQTGISVWQDDYGSWILACGGSLVNERWVVTAAHCVTYADTTIVIPAEYLKVYVGKYFRSDDQDDEHVQVRQIQEIHVHPDFHPLQFDADIGLIQLSKPVEFSPRVQPICLPTDLTTRSNLRKGNKGVVTGWGLTENGSYADTLQQAVLPVIPHDMCEENYEKAGQKISVTENMFCAGLLQGKTDACSGDSGGPMVFPSKDGHELKWTLEGIVSWGSPSGCGRPNESAVFTKVHAFLEWIQQFI